MNIGIARFGKTMNFLPGKWGSQGDFEPMIFTYWLAKNFPEHQFYVLSKSNGRKAFGKNIPNLHFLEQGSKVKLARYMAWLDSNGTEHSAEHESYMRRAWDQFGSVPMDYCFAFMGMMHKNCLPFTFKKCGADSFVRPSMIGFGYSSFVVYYLNKSMVPYSTMVTDIRHVRKGPVHGIIRNLVNPERHNLAQEDFVFRFSQKQAGNTRLWEGTRLPQRETARLEYAGLETIFLLLKEPLKEFLELDTRFLRQKSGFVLAHNHFSLPGEIPENIPRYTKLKSHGVFGLPVPTEIYGDWPQRLMETHPEFKGPLNIKELSERLLGAKYTLCLGTDGMVTQKFLEFAHHGVIPFVDSEYARNCSIDYIDPWFRFQSKQELLGKIRFAEASFENYVSRLRLLHSQLFRKTGDEFYFYSGKYLMEKVNGIIGDEIPIFKVPRKMLGNLGSLYEGDLLKEQTLGRFL
jgi:hypothetical protein